jgi:hypothetical protein
MKTQKFLLVLIAVVIVGVICVQSEELQLTCDNEDSRSHFINQFACSLNIKEPSGITVTSCDIDIERVKKAELEKRIFIKIVGNENYPEQMPSGLAAAISGVEIFSYSDSSLKHLKRLDFTGMNPKLTKVMLERNQIESIDGDAFHDLTKLVFLSLGHNKLQQLPDKLLSHAPKLAFLIIRDNQITEISVELLRHSQNLRKFYADRNQIVDVHQNMFDSSLSLMVVSMRGNKIKYVPFDFLFFSSLYVADFLDNDEGCDTIYNVNELVPKHCDDEECQRKTIRNIDEFQIKIEEICRN